MKLKSILKNTFDFFKRYFFILFCVLALVLPDICLKELLGGSFFDEYYVKVVSKLFTAGWIFFFVWLCVFILPKVLGKIVFAVISSVFIIFSICEYIYFKIFDQFFWLKSIMLASEGADYLSHVAKQIDSRLVIFTVLEILFLVLALVLWHKPVIEKKSMKLLAACPILCPIILISVTHICMLPSVHHDSSDIWNAWSKPRLVYQNFTDTNKCYELTGLYQFTYLDIYTSIFPNNDYGDDDYAKIEAFFDEKSNTGPNKYSDIFKGKNVIAVMTESMDTWMIDEKHTPTIYKMMNEGINFTNYNAPLFGNGYTFGSEFAFNTGFFTPESSVSAANFTSNSFPYALANVFSDAGYATNSFHFNNPDFYNRGIMHKRLGYEKYNWLAEYGITGTVAALDSNMLSDEVYAKMTEKTPFFNFVITYSAHLPYTGEDGKLALSKEYYPDLIDENEIPEKNNAKILAADTDKFFEILLQRLEADGLLDDTVIIAYTDHYAYGISDAEALKEWRGEEQPYRVPAFIYAKNIKPIEVSKPMMTIDWAPTIANLFGLESKNKYIGNDIFDPENKGFVFFENWGWMDDKMYYAPSNEVPEEADVGYIEEQNLRVKDSIEINDTIILSDYYKDH